MSEIDNRELAVNPLTNRGEDFTSDLENYVNDRIGFRNEMIYGYTVLNDKLFGKMVHPSYIYSGRMDMYLAQVYQQIFVIMNFTKLLPIW